MKFIFAKHTERNEALFYRGKLTGQSTILQCTFRIGLHFASLQFPRALEPLLSPTSANWMGGMFHEKRPIKRAKLFNAGCIRRFQNKNKILSGWSKFAGTRCYVTRNPYVKNEVIRRLSVQRTSGLAKLIGKRCVQRGKGHVHFRVATELRRLTM